METFGGSLRPLPLSDTPCSARVSDRNVALVVVVSMRSRLDALSMGDMGNSMSRCGLIDSLSLPPLSKLSGLGMRAAWPGDTGEENWQ